MKDSTRCALLTGAGRSAIAVIEVWGASAIDALAQNFQAVGQHGLQSGQVRYGIWRGRSSDLETTLPEQSDRVRATPSDPSPGESVVVVPTGGQRFEIHCHGGSAAIRRVIRDLSLVGVQEVSPRPTGGLPARDESTGGNRLGDRLISEACEALTQCTTVRTAAIVLDQVRGALRQWRDDSIDALRRQADQAHRIATEAEQLAAAGRVGVRLARPFDVVLAGLPNVGKSSLINALVGYDRSIVMEIAGTTRDVLNAETVLDGWPIRMRDTAGLHASVESIEQQGIERAMTAIDSADLVLLVTQPGGEGRQSRLHRAINRLGPTIPVIRVLNKSDLIDIDIREGEEVRDRDLIKTIATTGEGIPLLLRAISNALGRGMPAPGAPVPINARQRRWVDGIAALADDPQAMLDALSS